MSIIKIFIIALFLVVFVSLFQAVRIMSNPSSTKKMSQFLGRRLLISVVIFMLILLALGLGFISPNPRPY
ncbi:MAG: DUF2909 domain-containing protein [Gammaproteobacteria bacterium]|nr:DUF2909 domain-containing protein [Gammaproteobacteria bacterium]